MRTKQFIQKAFRFMILPILLLMFVVVLACFPAPDSATAAQSQTRHNKSPRFVEIHITMSQLEHENTIYEFTKFPGVVFKDWQTTWGFTGDTVMVKMAHLSNGNTKYHQARRFYSKHPLNYQTGTKISTYPSEWERQANE